MRALHCLIAFVLATGVVAQTAAAQTPQPAAMQPPPAQMQAAATPNEGFALNRFEPSEVGSDWFVGDSLDMRGEFRPGLRLTLDWAHKPLVRYDANGDEIAVVIERQIYGHAGVAFIIADRVRLGANLPVLLNQVSNEQTVGMQTFGATEGVAVGDLRLALDIRLAGEFGDPITLAIGSHVHVPTGNRDAFAGDGTVRLSPRLMIAGDLAALAYSLRASYNFRPQDDGFGTVPTGSEIAFVATAGIRAADGKLVIGPELWGTTTANDAAFEENTTPFELLFGGHYRTGAWSFGLGAGPGLNRGMGAPTVRVLASIELMPDVSDRDEDGIYDRDDACPDIPGPPNDNPELHGCPDRDGDEIIDPKDACPDKPGVPSDDPAKHGCPPIYDRDADGILDKDDSCPDIPGEPNDDPTLHGCPDRDGDGIIDPEDACPDTPGEPNDDPEKHGCPPADTDGDGILDDDDACPVVPGVPNKDPAKHGCPLAEVVEDQIRINERIEFELDKARILPESEVVLEAVQSILDAHPEIEEVRVEGHTDSQGRDKYNLKLSQRRAASVVKWLTDHGIDKSRLKPKGFGETRPIDDNETPEGRQRNRRVEFHITEGKVEQDKPRVDNASSTDKEEDDNEDEDEDEEVIKPKKGSSNTFDDDDPLKGL
jgi:outer membrane protein OmpA-like peptidoglycan-associated protein